VLTYHSAGIDASFRGAQRVLAAALPDCQRADGDMSLDGPMALERPRMAQATIIEKGPLRRVVSGEPLAAFGAFLDGIQRTRVLAYLRGVPIIHGTIAAVVLRRVDRKLLTWQAPLIERRLYLPIRLFSASEIAALQEHFDITNTDDSDGSPLDRHPIGLMERAVPLVQTDRSRLERKLAEAWCDAETEPLLMDGGIAGSERAAKADVVVGAIKTHRTIYLDGKPLDAVLALEAAERSPVFKVEGSRTAVASWYLRLRDREGHDPLWGLVRVEIAVTDRITERADEVSRWLLAERTPLALPDGRWDRMSYGVRGCEEYLRAIL
jgi:hypothetical protein